MIRFIFLFFPLFLVGETHFDNSFITTYEYGKMLYKNPRGVSCVKCHGEDAKGKVIARFKHIRNKKEYICDVRSKDITNVSYKKFKATLDPRLEKPKPKFEKNQICEKLTYGNSMPTYFLTNEELKSIHFYLVNKDSGKYE
jgi:pyridoxal biosynthesis lyase PdxS